MLWVSPRLLRSLCSFLVLRPLLNSKLAGNRGPAGHESCSFCSWRIAFLFREPAAFARTDGTMAKKTPFNQYKNCEVIAMCKQNSSHNVPWVMGRVQRKPTRKWVVLGLNLYDVWVQTIVCADHTQTQEEEDEGERWLWCRLHPRYWPPS